MSSAVDLGNDDRRIPLNRARVLHAAVDLADREGIDLVSSAGSARISVSKLCRSTPTSAARTTCSTAWSIRSSARSLSTRGVSNGGRPFDGGVLAARRRDAAPQVGGPHHRDADHAGASDLALHGSRHGNPARRRALRSNLSHHAMHVLGSRVLGFSQDLYDDLGVPDPEVATAWAAQLASVYPNIVRTRDDGQSRGWHRWLRRRLRIRVRARPHARWARAAARRLTERRQALSGVPSGHGCRLRRGCQAWPSAVIVSSPSRSRAERAHMPAHWAGAPQAVERRSQRSAPVTSISSGKLAGILRCLRVA